MILDFGVSEGYLATSSTDFKLKIFNLHHRKLDLSIYLESMATCVVVFECLECPEKKDIEIFGLGKSYTYIALGMINSIAIYKFSLRHKTISHLVTIFERKTSVNGE